MRFGPTPLADAEGAILAHSLRQAEITLKKGRRLTAEDLASLRAAGIETVTAARLEPGDVGEDEAARRLAQAIAGEGLELDKPFTGRVNLYARGRGLVVLDRERLERLNRIDEALTVATLPNHATTAARQMVATVKIIPFAVPGALLEQALAIAGEAMAGEDEALVRVAPYRLREATLIQTRLPGTKETMLDKTVAVTAGRLAGIGARLVREVRCAHAVEPLAARLREASTDLVLIAGASAITDRADVLPAAIEAAGGRVEHFGMPVDPGNLLLLARQGGRPVLGLPGCARSPKLNGFDWVLERLAAGVAVGRADIMAMGVGGLLMEIPSRPQPRAGDRPAKPGKVAAILLAAGQSRRMGAANKLLAPVDGQPLVAHALAALRASRARPIIAVTGHDAEAVQAALGEGITLVHNPAYAEGLSTSLQAGLAVLPDDAAGVLVALGDMPRLKPAQIDRLIAAFDPEQGRAIVVPTVRGKRGNPVLFATRFVPEMAAIAGDVGAKHLLGAHAAVVCEIEMDDEAALLDIDTPQALQSLRAAAS